MFKKIDTKYIKLHFSRVYIAQPTFLTSIHTVVKGTTPSYTSFEYPQLPSTI